MPGPTTLTPLQSAWLAFAESVRTLLSPQEDDRPLDQFLEFRDRAMSIVQSDAFVDGLKFPKRSPNDFDLVQVNEALLLELQAFPRATEVLKVVEPKSPVWKRWLRSLLGKAGTVAGSVKDLLENAPPLVKNGLTLFKELIELFKGHDGE